MPTVFRDQLILSYEIPKWDGDLGRPSIYCSTHVGRGASQGGAAAQVLPFAGEPRLVGRRGVPGTGPAPGHGVPGAVFGRPSPARKRCWRRTCGLAWNSHAAERVPKRMTTGWAWNDERVGGSSTSPLKSYERALYRGDVVVLTDLPSVRTLRRLHAGPALRAVQALRSPSVCMSTSTRRRWRGCSAPGSLASCTPPTSKELVGAIIREAGFCAEGTHYDVPKPRTSFPVDHLTTGIAYAFPWHRDVWYGAPAQQINWWLPVFARPRGQRHAVRPQDFDRAVDNSSENSTTTRTTPLV